MTVALSGTASPQPVLGRISLPEKSQRMSRVTITSPMVAIAMILLGGIEQVILHQPDFAHGLWMIGLIGAGIPVVWRTLTAVVEGRYNTDLVASFSIVTAAIIGQPFAGLVIVLMQTGGETLERFAERRASGAVSALEKAAPRIAHRLDAATGVRDVPAVDLVPGDYFVLRPGDLVPCDGVVTSGDSDVDTSQLTGEAVPLGARAGTTLMSGSLNLHGMLTVRVTARAAESQYSQIVELVRRAQGSKSPLQRLADRYAIWFTPVTLLVCLIAFAATHSWTTVLAVLVVATPCPLILATPVAIIGGINRAAKSRIIMRNGAALENLSKASTAVFDKTGTMTVGQPKVDRVLGVAGFSSDDVLRFAAGAEQGSGHLLARVVVDEAQRRFGGVPAASGHLEAPGEGVAGEVNGVSVAVGGKSFVARHSTVSLDAFAPLESRAEGLRAYVIIEGKPAGVIEFADTLRPNAKEVLDSLTGQGFTRQVLLSGDSVANTRAIGSRVGVAETHGELLPADKAVLLSQYKDDGSVVMMVGDGTNDAPALAIADVGIALAGHGGGVTSEAADVILLADDLNLVVKSVEISQRTMRIARQSIVAGLALSAVAMIFAALGRIAPTDGALLQEAIDVAVIANALRASWGWRGPAGRDHAALTITEER